MSACHAAKCQPAQTRGSRMDGINGACPPGRGAHREREEIKHLGAVPPGVGVAVLALALIVEAVHLRMPSSALWHSHITTAAVRRPAPIGVPG